MADLQKKPKPMEAIVTAQEEFIAETQKQIEGWQAQMAECKKALDAAEAQAKAEFDGVVGQLEESVLQAQGMVRQAQAANGKAWSDMEAATWKAMNQLQSGWQKAISRYQ